MLIITGNLVARTAIHIGRGTSLDVTDSICARDQAGDYVLPGMPIAGALRTLAIRIAPRLGSQTCRALWPQEKQKQSDKPCGCWVCHLFGDINPGEGGDETSGGRASRLLVAHAEGQLPVQRMPRIRDGVGIDRTDGAACRAGSVKFDLEVLPKDTHFILRLEVEDANEHDEILLVAILHEWREGRAWLGGRAARGLGAFDLRDVICADLNLDNSDGLLAFLRDDTPWQQAKPRADWLNNKIKDARQQIDKKFVDYAGVPKSEVAGSFLAFEFDLQLDGAFLTNDTTAAFQTGLDHVPLFDIVAPNGKALLPGSLLRGVMRSHAERVVRTLATLSAKDSADFLRQCPACSPLENNADKPLACCDTLLRNPATTLRDNDEIAEGQLCLACRLFGSSRRGSRLFVEDTEENGNSAHKLFDFLAIDRFTGGGREGAKFDALMAWKPMFTARIYLENPTPWELGWLILVLRDMREMLLPIGMGAAKGFGQVALKKLIIRHGFLCDQDYIGPVLTQKSNETSGLYQSQRFHLASELEWQQWQTWAQPWIKALRDKCQTFMRNNDHGNLPPLASDSYFGKDNLSTLYDKEAYRCLLKP